MAMLLFHIAIALSSLVASTVLFLSPTKTKLNLTYALVGTTLFTGFYLVWTSPAHIVSACISGLIYLGLVSIGIISARTKLQTKKIKPQ